ncbi:MAG: lipoyl(octanoyl) transferase LipB [Gammaproteobacteria bacterium]
MSAGPTQVSADPRPVHGTTLKIRRLGRVEYAPVWREMQSFTETRSAKTPDELWLLEHLPVFTMGRNARQEHLLATGDIPVIQTDRGGQVTYHGPGQLLAYTLLDIQRRQLGVQSLVNTLEQAVINLLSDYGIQAARRSKAPGVYVDERKIAALGLRVRKGCCFHGLSLNVDMDLAPFSMINPCGIQDLEVTRMSDLGIGISVDECATQFGIHFEQLLMNFTP